jgi:probable H4MPT-linked C1 transfer pathway protein
MALRSLMIKTSPQAILAFDIGGANLKAYHSDGTCRAVAFPMWRRPKSLAVELVSFASCFSEAQNWCATITGEMADVFENRQDGVRTIVQQTMNAAEAMGIHNVRFYATIGCFVGSATAMEQWETVASANWHALAQWISTWVDRPSLLVDIGSTTVDLIPILSGQIDSPSRTDFDRLSRGELVYLGIERTPVCALVDWFPFDGSQVPVMREVFATTDDCALVLGWVGEDEADTNTCDSRPRTRRWAVNRLARMIGLSDTQVKFGQAQAWAHHVMMSAAAKVSAAALRHPRHCESQWIISGHAKNLASPPPAASVIDLSIILGASVSRVAPAYAIAQLFEAAFCRPEAVKYP